jgi:hypothetical protein
MNTKDYWELSEEERATLTQEQVERYADYELMAKGVLRASTLELEAVPEVPDPSITFFRINRDSWHKLDIAFRSSEAAMAFLALGPVMVETNYHGGRTAIESAKAFGNDATVSAQKLRSEEESSAVLTTVKRAAEISASNDKRREEHDKAVRAQEEALVGIWNDWRRCRERDANMRRIVKIYEEYVATAGDATVAAKFLLKAFPRDQIEEASQWTGQAIGLPEVATDETPKKAPSPLAGQLDDVAV